MVALSLPGLVAALEVVGLMKEFLRIPQDRLLKNSESSQHLPITMQSLHPIIDQTRCCGIETPDGGVPILHFLLVPGMILSGGYKDPFLDVLRDRVPNDGL